VHARSSTPLLNGSALRQAAFVVITATYFGLWIAIFWPTIATAVQARDIGSLRPLAIILGLGVAVALLLPMSGSRGGVPRWVTIGLLTLLVVIAAVVWIGLVRPGL
jgi:hypothetical protein